MEKESEYLLHLLGAYLREEEPQVREDVQWTKLIELSQIHCVTGIVGYMSMAHPICPDPQLKEALREVCLNTVALFTRRGAMAEDFSGMLARNGIDHILMKGYVLRDYYPVPELRTFGDIDIVIRPEDRERSNALLLSQGYQAETDWEPIFSYTRGEEYYELHAEIMEVNVSDKADYREYFRGMWRYAREEEPHRFRFTPEYHFLYMLTHIAKHVASSGAGIRMYLDVAAFIRHFGDSLDWAYVRGELEDLAFLDFANTVLTVTERYFGVPSPIPLTPMEEETLSRFLEVTMRGGVFGKAGQDGGAATLRIQSRDRERVSRLGVFTRRLFPSAKTIESRYTYLQDKPWLLPVAWIHRLVRTRGTWVAHAEEAQQILTADVDEVMKLRQLYKDIGL